MDNSLRMPSRRLGVTAEPHWVSDRMPTKKAELHLKAKLEAGGASSPSTQPLLGAGTGDGKAAVAEETSLILSCPMTGTKESVVTLKVTPPGDSNRNRRGGNCIALDVAPPGDRIAYVMAPALLTSSCQGTGTERPETGTGAADLNASKVFTSPKLLVRKTLSESAGSF